MTNSNTALYTHGFNGSREQLLRALRYHAKRESLSTFHVKEAAAYEIERLAEYEWMYKELCK